MGDFNSDLGSSLGNRVTVNPNQRGVKLVDFANYFNLYPTNILSICKGPLETYFPHCESQLTQDRSQLITSFQYKSIDHIFLPNCLYHSIVSCRTFNLLTETLKTHQIMFLSSCRWSFL